MNILKEKILRSEKLCGTLACLTDPALCEIFGNIGYDFIWIDTEHTYMSFKEVLCHLNAARSAGTPAIVRVPQNDLTATKKILEMGPEGIIFPMLRTSEEVRAAIEMTLYPPYGNRGFGPLRAIQYGKRDAQEYIDKGSIDDLCRFIQIEHIDCIDNLEEIFKIPYIDGYIFGPNDLSGSVGAMGHAFDEKTTKQIERAIKILKANGKYVGLAGGYDEKTIKHWSDMGVDMLTTGADWNFVYDLGKQNLERLKKIHIKGE